jgi:hypothetical protein
MCLQRKLVAGQHTAAAALAAHPTPDATSSRNLRLDDQGLLEPEATNVQQFAFTLERAVHVGPSGFLKQRQPLRSVARMVLFDRQQNKFIGPAHCIPAAFTSSKECTWTWEPHGAPAAAPLGSSAATSSSGSSGSSGPLGGANTAVVRFDSVQADPVGGSRQLAADRLMLYVELNVAFPLTAEDAEVVPESERKVGAPTALMCLAPPKAALGAKQRSLQQLHKVPS